MSLIVCGVKLTFVMVCIPSVLHMRMESRGMRKLSSKISKDDFRVWAIGESNPSLLLHQKGLTYLQRIANLSLSSYSLTCCQHMKSGCKTYPIAGVKDNPFSRQRATDACKMKRKPFTICIMSRPKT